MPTRTPLAVLDTLFQVIDTETTGLDPAADKIVEVGTCVVVGTNAPGDADSWLVDPGMPIPPIAKAVHHITDADVAGKPSIDQVLEHVVVPASAAICTVYVAHNAPFDRGFLEAAGFPTDVRWLDTYRLAMHLWPEAPSYKNEVLRYWLGFDVVPWAEQLAFDKGKSVQTHSAWHDVQVTALVLQNLLKHCTKYHDIDELIAFANGAVVLKGVLGFGKHFDKTWAQVLDADPGYLEWMVRQEGREPGSWDPDKVHTATWLLGRLI